MKTKSYFIALATSAFLINPAFADVKAQCEAAMDRDGAPAAAKAGCGCIATAIGGDNALETEFLRITSMPQAERTSVDSPDVMAVMQKCYVNPQ
jgi:hypothetical protein